MKEGYYYHAGAMCANGDVRWSDSTRRSSEVAEREAKAMARKYGGKPVVEYWKREHGMRPGDADAVAGAYTVEM